VLSRANHMRVADPAPVARLGPEAENEGICGNPLSAEDGCRSGGQGSSEANSHNARLSAVTRPFVQFRAFLELSRKQRVLASVADRPVFVAVSARPFNPCFVTPLVSLLPRMSAADAQGPVESSLCRIDRTELGGE